MGSLVALAGLAIALLAALALAIARGAVAPGPGLAPLTTAYALAIALQAIHAAEEFATGFYARFPTALGLEPWPASFFVVFNLGWIAIWTASLAMLGARFRLLSAPAWFLAIAACANAIAHPALAFATRGYFPGLVSSIPLGVAGVVLFGRLWRATAGTRA